MSDTPWEDYLWRARVSAERPSMAEVLRAALSEDTEQVGPVFTVPDLVPLHFDEAMKVTDAEFHDGPCKGWIVMSPRSYADVRMFGRDVLDIETCAPRPLTGATLWGYPILTSRDVEPGVAWFVGKRRDGSWARMKVEHVEPNQEFEITYKSLRVWLWALVSVQRGYGCRYERCDDPRKRMLGMRNPESGARYMIPLVRVMDRTSWEIELPSSFVEMLKTPKGRDKLAWVLSVGDHCLEF